MPNEHSLSICSSNYTPRYLHKWVKALGPNKILCTKVYSSCMHKCQTPKAIKMPLNRWMQKQTVVYLYRGMLFGNELSGNELSSHETTWRSLKCTLLKCEKPVGKGHYPLSISSCMTFWKRPNSSDSRKIRGFQRIWEGSDMARRTSGHFEREEAVLEGAVTICKDTWYYSFFKTHETVQHKEETLVETMNSS